MTYDIEKKTECSKNDFLEDYLVECNNESGEKGSEGSTIKDNIKVFIIIENKSLIGNYQISLIHRYVMRGLNRRSFSTPSTSEFYTHFSI